MRQRNLRFGIGALFGALLLGLVTTCLLPRYPSVAPRKTSVADTALADCMNPWLLAEGFTDRLLVEVDWVAGCKPGPRTLEGLRAMLRRYGPRGRALDLLLDQEIPRTAWEEILQQGHPDAVAELVERYAGPSAERAGPEYRTERRYVLFAPFEPHTPALYGYSGTWIVRRAAVPVRVEGVAVFRRPHARWAKLWISLDKLERMTLLHEFGHQLGLVCNPAHERTRPHRGHCTRLKCVMSHPTPRVIARHLLPGLFNVFPDDYGPDCRRDIARAQAAWRAAMAADPEFRARKVAERAAGERALALWPLLEEGRYEALLAQAREALRRYGSHAELHKLELRALVELGRTDEAAARWREVAAGWSADDRLAAAWPLARAWIAEGRHADAVALFDSQDPSRRATMRSSNASSSWRAR